MQGYNICIISMLAIDSVNDLGTGSYCMFTYTRKNVATRLTHPVLEMHWAVCIPANALLRIGPPIITATVFEFTQVRSKPSLYERSIFSLVSFLL